MFNLVTLKSKKCNPFLLQNNAEEEGKKGDVIKPPPQFVFGYATTIAVFPISLLLGLGRVNLYHEVTPDR